MAHLYYREDASAAVFKVGAVIAVDGDEARHAVRVSRLRLGERISLGNGRGTIAHGEVVRVDKSSFAVRVDELTTFEPPDQRLVLVQALAKGDRDDRAVEQATEFGVDAIIPWQASRSVSRWDGQGGADKVAKGLEKWARVAREAAKQSVRAFVPEVRSLATIESLCASARDESTRVIVLHPRGTKKLSDWAHSQLSDKTSEVLIVVGPEGGLSDAELEALEHAGAHVVLLGEHVLRTSSAGPAAIAVLNLALQRW